VVAAAAAARGARVVGRGAGGRNGEMVKVKVMVLDFSFDLLSFLFLYFSISN